ncbi:MAG: hypothetical protein PF569_07855 [Candidatus Woesearchaeota archaeon]|jgi:hypothetical protein|nr:hypothetical protein [Candidatus Woesearchaeota archaeon]
MFMINIPRRKIYETMLVYEEHLLEIQILIKNEKNFTNYQKEFEESYIDLIKAYKRIKALFILFFENKKYETEDEFEADVIYYIKEEKETNKLLKENKNLTKNYLKLQKTLDETFENETKVENIKQGEELFIYLDKFNSYIPVLLEIRRDFMR